MPTPWNDLYLKLYSPDLTDDKRPRLIFNAGSWLLLYFSMTGVGGRPELIIKGSNSLEGPWEVGSCTFNNILQLFSKIWRSIFEVDFISCFRNTTSYTSLGMFINLLRLLVSLLHKNFFQIVVALGCSLDTKILYERLRSAGQLLVCRTRKKSRIWTLPNPFNLLCYCVTIHFRSKKTWGNFTVVCLHACFGSSYAKMFKDEKKFRQIFDA